MSQEIHIELDTLDGDWKWDDARSYLNNKIRAYKSLFDVYPEVRLYGFWMDSEDEPVHPSGATVIYNRLCHVVKGIEIKADYEGEEIIQLRPEADCYAILSERR